MLVKIVLIGPSHPAYSKTDRDFTQARIISIDESGDGKEFPFMQVFGPNAKMLAHDIIDRLGWEIEKE